MQTRQRSCFASSGGSIPSDKGGGGGHLDPKIRGGAGFKKHFFRPFGPQFGSKIRGGGGPGPSPGSPTEKYCLLDVLLAAASLNLEVPV